MKICSNKETDCNRTIRFDRDTEDISAYKLKAILFDMDNTLFDFVAAKLKACREILFYIEKEKGKVAGEPAELLDYFLRGIYGFEDYENISDYMQEKEMFSLHSYWECCKIYEKEKLQNLELYSGVKETLYNLKKLDLKFIIITDASRYHALVRLKQVKLLDCFDFLVTSDMTGTKKPNPAHFLFALQKLGIKPEEVLVVGDSIRRDIIPARKLGMKTAYASYGDWRPIEDVDCSFDFKLNEFSELLTCIVDLENSNL
ncbi:MAG: HAD family hydrolase [Methanosarcina sp.]